MALMRRQIISVSLITLAGLAMARLYLEYNRFGLGTWFDLPAMLAGTANRPWVYRQLAPLVIRAGMALTGAAPATVATWLMYVSCVGWLLALWWWARAVLSERAALAAALIAPWPVALLFVTGGYIYDLPTLALSTASLALLAHRRWRAYLILFPAAMLCKETAALLIGVYALHARTRLEPRRFGLGLAAQIAAAVLIKAGLAAIYSHNPGALFEIHWQEHLQFLYDFPSVTILALVVYGLAVAAALVRWKDQPAILQDAGLMIPAMFAAYWLLGFPGEGRAVLEAYPPLFLLAFQTVWKVGARPTIDWMEWAWGMIHTEVVATMHFWIGYGE